jgi:hypothetical protein
MNLDQFVCCNKITIRDSVCVEEAASTFFDIIEHKYGRDERKKLMEKSIVRRLFVVNDGLLRPPNDKIYYRWEGEGEYSFYY